MDDDEVLRVRLAVAQVRVAALRHEVAMRRALKDARRFANALLAMQADFEAEVAVARFEGRVPPSAEVFYSAG